MVLREFHSNVSSWPIAAASTVAIEHRLTELNINPQTARVSALQPVPGHWRGRDLASAQ
jgi:hypothetical protein